MTTFIDDPDLTVYVGDVREVLMELPDGSVDCVVTSPPYWGLRDYGTGEWDGGDPGCDHKQTVARHDGGRVNVQGFHGSAAPDSDKGPMNYRDVCGKCGATRVDKQIGLEPTPEKYVEAMVGVFREVWRVLSDHGTCWVNLGDSYAQSSARSGQSNTHHAYVHTDPEFRDERYSSGVNISAASAGVKPKDLAGIPWMVAFALRADGWYLRSDIVWSKPNPMPESVTDRPTKSHEYVFLLSKRPRYWFDAEAVREPADRAGETIKGDRAPGGLVNGGWLRGGTVAAGRNVRSVWEIEQETLDPSLPPEKPRGPDGRRKTTVTGKEGSIQHRDGERWPTEGANVKSVWNIATQPYAEAHFATFPEELVRRCLLAGCPVEVCRVCGVPRERIVEVSPMEIDRSDRTHPLGRTRSSGTVTKPRESSTVGWSDCGHNDFRPGIVLDPFLGSGTTAVVARKHGRRCVGIELNESYAQLIRTRTSQLSLLAES